MPPFPRSREDSTSVEIRDEDSEDKEDEEEDEGDKEEDEGDKEEDAGGGDGKHAHTSKQQEQRSSSLAAFTSISFL